MRRDARTRLLAQRRAKLHDAPPRALENTANEGPRPRRARPGAAQLDAAFAQRLRDDFAAVEATAVGAIETR
jgi:hypothetical protein